MFLGNYFLMYAYPKKYVFKNLKIKLKKQMVSLPLEHIKFEV